MVVIAVANTGTATSEQKHLATQFEIVALILADRLSEITDSPLKSTGDASSSASDAFSRFIRAYVLYRGNREQEALGLLKGMTAKERILEAQIVRVHFFLSQVMPCTLTFDWLKKKKISQRYRIGDYSLAAQLLAGLDSVEDDPDIQTNLLACCLFSVQHFAFEQSLLQRVLSTGSISNFELAFNAVLLQIANWSAGLKGAPRFDEIQKWSSALKSKLLLLFFFLFPKCLLIVVFESTLCRNLPRRGENQFGSARPTYFTLI